LHLFEGAISPRTSALISIQASNADPGNFDVWGGKVDVSTGALI